MNTPITIASLLSIVLLCSGCTNPKKTENSFCSSAENKPKPSWVDNIYNHPVDDYIYGYGQINFSTQQPSSDLYKKAIAHARIEISESIEVRIKNDIEIIEHQTVSNSNQDNHSTFNQKIKINSDQILINTEVTGTWQDPSSCSVFAQVRMPKNISNLVQKKSLANSLYEQSKNENITLAQRKSLIESAIDTAREWEFGILPNSLSSSALIEKYLQEKNKIQALISSEQNKYTIQKGMTRLLSTPYGIVQKAIHKERLFIALPKSNKIVGWTILVRDPENFDKFDLKGISYSISIPEDRTCVSIQKSIHRSSPCGRIKSKAGIIREEDFYIFGIPLSELKYFKPEIGEVGITILTTREVELNNSNDSGFISDYYPLPTPTMQGNKLYGYIKVQTKR